MVVTWEYLEGFGKSIMQNTNVMLAAACTTAQGRLKLYKYLDALEDQVLYYDTGSLFYVHKSDLY